MQERERSSVQPFAVAPSVRSPSTTIPAAIPRRATSDSDVAVTKNLIAAGKALDIK